MMTTDIGMFRKLDLGIILATEISVDILENYEKGNQFSGILET